MIVGVNQEENEILNNIFKKYSDNYDFYYYGSRVKGGFRDASDLDVMIKKIDGQQVPYRIIDELKGLFDVSELHFIVNFVDYFDIKDDFFNKIKGHIVKAELYDNLNNKVIILNGGSSVGKSSIVKEFQEIANECFYRIEMDTFHYFLPEKYKIYSTKQKNELTEENKKGFWFDDSGICKYGEYANNISNDLINIIDCLIKQNRNLIIDYVLFGLDDLKIIAKKFKDYNNVYIVRAFCDIEELRKRELKRLDRKIGSAEATQLLIDTKYNDLTLNTTNKTPKELAEELYNFINNNKATKLQELYKDINNN